MCALAATSGASPGLAVLCGSICVYFGTQLLCALLQHALWVLFLALPRALASRHVDLHALAHTEGLAGGGCGGCDLLAARLAHLYRAQPDTAQVHQVLAPAHQQLAKHRMRSYEFARQAAE